MATAPPRMTTSHAVPGSNGGPKRLICCCDGTWMDSLGKQSGEPQSNVTRISRVLRRTSHRGMHQVIAYNSGVGSGNALDRVTGGMFGSGLEQNIREVYNFVCTNFVDGDEIILIGFSRGAFTARSVADMIASIGLLTPAGLDHFYAIFEDYEHMGESKRPMDEFLCDRLPPYNGEQGEDKLRWEAQRKDVYRVWLKTFTNTEVSDKVENAFQALALDEHRFAFRPALWERINGNRTNLRQVWFPGNHSAAGGGWHDQQIATISLAWMCDQLSTLGIAFNLSRMTEVFMEGLAYSATHPFPVAGSVSSLPSWATSFLPWKKTPSPIPWASSDICHATNIVRDNFDHDDDDCKHPNAPPEHHWQTARPWGLGQIRATTNRLMAWAGQTVRYPGLFMRADCDTNVDTDQPLLNTDERIHSCVRVRLACDGLGLDDHELWRCKALCEREKEKGRGRGVWRLQQGSAFGPSTVERVRAFRPRELECGYPEDYLYPVGDRDGEWQWVYDREDEVVGSGHMRVPQMSVLPEEPLVGYWERYLLNLTAGNPDVWRYALDHPPFDHD